MVGGRIICAVGSLSLGIWAASSRFDDAQSAAPVVVASFVVGCGFAVGGPALQSVVPTLVRPGELAAAMTLNTVPMSLSRVIGPAGGAAIAGAASPAAAFFFAAATQVAFALSLCLLPSQVVHEGGSGKNFVSCLRFVRHDRALQGAILGVAALGFGSEATTTLAPALADRAGLGDQGVGAITSTFGAGAMVGIFGVSTLARLADLALQASLGLALSAAGLAAAATAALAGLSGTLILPWFAISGLGFSVGLASLGTVIQQRSPADLRGRMMALWLIGFVGSRPVASTLLGLVSDLTRVEVSVLLCSCALVGVAAFARPSAIRTGQVEISQGLPHGIGAVP